MKLILKSIFLLSILSASTLGVVWSINNLVVTRGTVEYFSFEGGFYGIISNSGKGYDPINLPPEFQENGTKVFIIAQKNLKMLSDHMWGEIIRIISIRKI